MMFFSLSLPQLPFLDTGYFFYHNGIAKARRRRSLQHKLHLEKDSRVSVSSLCHVFFVTQIIFYEIRVMIRSVVMTTFSFPHDCFKLGNGCVHISQTTTISPLTTNTLTFSQVYPSIGLSGVSLQHVSVHSHCPVGRGHLGYSPHLSPQAILLVHGSSSPKYLVVWLVAFSLQSRWDGFSGNGVHSRY